MLLSEQIKNGERVKVVNEEGDLPINIAKKLGITKEDLPELFQ